MSGETPDPEAIYEALEGFTTRLEDGSDINVRGGSQWFGSDPVVMQHPQFFRPESQDASRRRQAAALLEALAPPLDSPTTPIPDDVHEVESGADEGYRYSHLKREDILAAKRAHDAEGHNSEEPA